MTQYSKWVDPTKVTSKIIQSADAADLQDQINKFIGSLTVGVSVVVGMSLAGAGDGHTFVVVIDVATIALPAPFAGGLAAGSALGNQPTQVRCFLAGSADALAVAQAAAGSPAPLGSAAFVSVDKQMAGAAKGTRFMGMTVFTLATIPFGAISPEPVEVQLTVDQALAVGANILTFSTFDTNLGYSLPAPQVLQYNGFASFLAAIEVSLTVKQNAAGGFTVEIIRDPLGTPAVKGGPQLATVDATPGSENVTVTALQPIEPISPDNKWGVRVTASATGNVLSGQLRIIPA